VSRRWLQRARSSGGRCRAPEDPGLVGCATAYRIAASTRASARSVKGAGAAIARATGGDGVDGLGCGVAREPVSGTAAGREWRG
jgi:hypothetical protein